MAREVIIKIIGDDKDIDSTIDKLVKLRVEDEKNAKQFKENNAAWQLAHRKNLGILEQARLKERALLDARERSANPKAIERYNKLLDDNRKKVDRLTGQARTQTKQMSQLNSIIMNVGASFLAAFSIQQVIAFGKELKSLSIQLDADAKKSAIVFGSELQKVSEAAKQNAINIGLTTNEYIRAAASTQDLLVPLGFARKEAAQMSIELTNLSGALSVWSGGTVSATEVSTILTKALLGETEQLKTLGVLVDQSSSSFNERLKETMKTTGATQEQAKALDILNQIMSKSIDAQNSFKDSTKTLAEEEAKLNATLKTQKEFLAKELTPVWRKTTSDILRRVSNFVVGFKAIGDSWDSMITSLRAGYVRLTKGDIAAKIYLSNLKAQKEGTDKYNQSLEALDFAMRNNSGETEESTTTITKSTKETKKALTEKQKLVKQINDLKSALDDQALAGDVNIETLTRYNELLDKLAFAEETLAINMRIAKGESTDRALLFSEDMELMDEAQDVSFQKWTETEQGKTDVTKANARMRMQMTDEEMQHFQQQAFATVGRLQQTFQAYTNSRIAQIDELVAKEVITEEEGEARKKALLVDAAKRDQLFKIFEVITNTAQSISLAYATIPFPFNNIVAGINASIGAAQLGIIQSTPLPAYAKGTKGKQGSGLSRVGEEGEELVFLPHGAKVLPNKQTVENADLIDAMYDNRLDEFIFKNYMPKMLQAKSQENKDKDFIEKLTTTLGSEGFSEDGIIRQLKRLDSNDDYRIEKLTRAIVKAQGNRLNLRNRN